MLEKDQIDKISKLYYHNAGEEVATFSPLTSFFSKFGCLCCEKVNAKLGETVDKCILSFLCCSEAHPLKMQFHIVTYCFSFSESKLAIPRTISADFP